MPDTSSNTGATRLCVLRAFELLVRGRRARLSAGPQRLLTLLAVRHACSERTLIAARLWPDLPEARAAAALRTTLWQVRRAAPGAVVGHGSGLELSAGVRVDLRESLVAARRLESDQVPPDDVEAAFGHDVLPEWTEDWIVVERERFRQVRLHALEAVCRCLTEHGMHSEAIVAGLSAVAAEPLRESAQRALIEAHIAEGNISEAVRQYRSFARALHASLGVPPTPELSTLIPVAPVRLRVRV